MDIRWIDSETLTRETYNGILAGLDGILVPGGFGSRGIEGMILAAEYARENHIPYFGICLGMQIMVIEFARFAGLQNANSGEFDPDAAHKVIDFMPGQSDEINKGGTLRLGAYPCTIVNKGGTLRLGAYPCTIASNTTMHRCYGTTQISERHRHRYEFNNEYRSILTDAGLTLSGVSPNERTAGRDC